MLNLILIIISCLLVLAFLAVFLYTKFRNPLCGADINLSKLVCYPMPEKTDNVVKLENYLASLYYIQRLTDMQRSSSTLQKKFSKFQVISGAFIFIIPEILKLLPSDFGQNPVTPYGVVNFMNSYIPCISKISEFCESLLKDSSSSVKSACRFYLDYIKENLSPDSCPFSITDSSPDVYLENIDFFNTLGLLGAFSLQPSQVIVLKMTIPAKDLKLFYWSINLYVSETFTPTNVCYPYQQINFASVTAPLNNFRAASLSKKSPFDNVSGIILIALEESAVTLVQQKLQDEKMDFMYTFKIPGAPSSLPLQTNLPNPNNLTTESPYFDYRTQRLALLFRMNNNDLSDQSSLSKYIYQIDQNNFDLFMVNLVINETPTLFAHDNFPKIIPPPVDETKMYAKLFQKTNQTVMDMFGNEYLFAYDISTRYSLLNITAPLYRQVLMNKSIPYKGGYQALQMAGNMQGDNHDTQYRSSQTVCLGDQEALIGIFVNHSAIGNCMYNSVSLTDLNRAFGYDSINFTLADKTQDFQMLIVLAGRDKTFLNFLEKSLTPNLPKNTKIFQIPIVTGYSHDFNIPANHQVLLIERAYLNTNFQWKNKVYSIMDFIEIQDNQIQIKDGVDLESFQNICAPALEYMIPPKFYKVQQNQNTLQYIILAFALMFLVLFITFCFLQRFQTKKKN